MRRRGVKHVDERFIAHPEVLCLNPTENKGKWQEVFVNKGPVHLEIGMGKGDFLIDLARKNPHINYIGMEKYASVIVVAIDKIVSSGLKNIILICDDANNLLDIFDEHEIDKIYLNFSDPWPKTRHAKRRLTSEIFLSKYEVILKNNSTIEFKTDNQPLFVYSIVSFNNHDWKILQLTFDLHHDYDTDIISKTEYEKRFMALGQPIYFVEIVKK